MSEEYTDWRGHPVKPKDVVLYPSMRDRSCQMTEGILLSVWRVYYHPDNHEWTRLEPGQEIPTQPTWRRGEVVGKEECRTQWRAQVRPTADSRFTRWSTQGDWDHETLTRGPEKPAKPITLTVVKNLTWFSTPQL